MSLLALLLACSPPVRTASVPAPTDSTADTARAPDTSVNIDTGVDTSDSAVPADSGLAWSGDLARYDGCTAGDPEAKLLSESGPVGRVVAGEAVDGEVVVANCGTGTWRAAMAVDSPAGVKLGPLAATVADTWGDLRVLLPGDVTPGQAVRIAWTGVAPWSNGPHRWQWQLLDEWVRMIEAPTPARTVEVTGGYGPFTVHPREEWERADQPVAGPDMDLLALEFVTLHYNGVAEDLDGDDDVYADEDAIDRIRNVQAYSLATNDGISAGYNSYISPDGDEWEIRGHDIRNAASGCLDVNVPGYTIVVPTTDPSASPTPAQVEGVKAAVLRIRAAAAAAGNPRWLVLNGHRDVAPLCDLGTSCPGEPLYGLLQWGLLEP